MSKKVCEWRSAAYKVENGILKPCYVGTCGYVLDKGTTKPEGICPACHKPIRVIEEEKDG
jgi:predicted Zn-ribbon and HTH transcriptional regulator